MSTMHVTIITPDTTTFSGEATMVVGRALDGEFGILPHHAPLVSALASGTIRIDHDGASEEFVLPGGFLEVEHNSVYITTTSCERVE